MGHLLEEIRARKLDRVIAAYAVGGWLVVQGAAIVMPTFNAPVWALRALIIVVIVGFPVALAAAWMLAPRKSVNGKSAAHKAFGAVLVVGVIVALILGEAAYRLAGEAAPPGSVAPNLPAPAEASIAVLPFANMSGDASRDYFSDGIAEELLNDLANTPELHVAARTSSFAFKGRNVDIKEIARQLNVRTVLEGSVREYGGKVRITAQLINAADGYNLWSQTYDRALTDILTLQSEIAQAITTALTHNLLALRPHEGRPKSIAPDAYRDYLQGQFFFDQRTKESNARAIELFKRVAAAQPDFADAYAALGYAYEDELHLFEPADPAATQAAADAAVTKALALDPKHLIALLTHLDLALGRWDWETATADLKRMRTVNPGNAVVLRAAANYYGLLGFPTRAIDAYKATAALDPLSLAAHLNLSVDYLGLARYPEAADAARAALALQPAHPYALHNLCVALARGGHAREAADIQAKLAAAHDSEGSTDCGFEIALGAGDRAAARKIVDGWAAQNPETYTDIGVNYAEVGDLDKAMDWLERGFNARESDIFYIPYGNRSLPRALFATPRWKALTQLPEYKKWQAAHDRVAAELAGE